MDDINVPADPPTHHTDNVVVPPLIEHSVVMNCGCIYRTHMTNGGRMYVCRHQIRYIISANTENVVHFYVKVSEDPNHIVTERVEDNE